MSRVEIKMCDIENCRNEATDHIKHFIVCRQENGDGAFKLYDEGAVDLCGSHDLQYRRAVPDMRVVRKTS